MTAGVLMLTKSNRLRTRAEFDRVFSEGKSAHGQLLSVRVADAAQLKAGFTVGKSVSLRAVIRNRTRRRLQEIVRGLELPPVELVVSAKRPAAKADTAGLRAELERLLTETGALK